MSSYYSPFGVLSDPYYSNPANNPILGNFGTWPGTAASNFGESYNPAIGNFTTNPNTNRMLDNVNYMSSYYMGPWQNENGVPAQYPGDPYWNQFTANDPYLTLAGGGVPSSSGGNGSGSGGEGPSFAGHKTQKLNILG